jgi:hypothetical protein
MNRYRKSEKIITSSPNRGTMPDPSAFWLLAQGPATVETFAKRGFDVCQPG